MPLSDQKGWSENPPLPRLQLWVISGHESIFLVIPACLRSSESKQLLFLISVSIAVVCEQILACCSPGSCCSAVIAVFSVLLHLPFKNKLP